MPIVQLHAPAVSGGVQAFLRWPVFGFPALGSITRAEALNPIRAIVPGKTPNPRVRNPRGVKGFTYHWLLTPRAVSGGLRGLRGYAVRLSARQLQCQAAPRLPFRAPAGGSCLGCRWLSRQRRPCSAGEFWPTGVIIQEAGIRCLSGILNGGRLRARVVLFRSGDTRLRSSSSCRWWWRLPRLCRPFQKDTTRYADTMASRMK